MNVTISVLEGLLLLLPGLTALGVWNLIGSGEGARRPELPLTAVNSLVVAMLVALVVHLAGIMLAELVVRAGADWNAEGLTPTLPRLGDPYANAVSLLSDHPAQPDGGSFFALLLVVLAECLVVARVIRSQGLVTAFAGYDLRGVGWAHKHYMEPLARGYIPIAFVMLKAIDRGRGLGYAGPIDDLRFGAQGEVASISLGQPQRFTYEVGAGGEGAERTLWDKVLRRPPRPSDLTFHEREWVGGVVHLSAGDIHNLVVHNLSPAQLQAFNAQPRT